MGELFSMMNMLNPDKYDCRDGFHDLFGGGKTPPTVPQIQALQDALRPLLLRRMKEDVENLPEKEEVIIWVQQTIEQAVYYKALYAGQIGALLGGANKAASLPGLRNLAMELRKLCCHPVRPGRQKDCHMQTHSSATTTFVHVHMCLNHIVTSHTCMNSI